MQKQIEAMIELSRVMAEKARGYDSAIGRYLLARALDINALAGRIGGINVVHEKIFSRQKAQLEAAKALMDKLLATRWGQIGARLWWRGILKG
jgi:hypothetical protein